MSIRVHKNPLTNYLNEIVNGVANGDVLTAHKDHLRLAGSLEGAIFLGRLIYLTIENEESKRFESGVPITYPEWEASTGIKPKAVKKLSEKFQGLGFLKTSCRKNAGNPTIHYLFSINLFSQYLAETNPTERETSNE